MVITLRDRSKTVKVDGNFDTVRNRLTQIKPVLIGPLIVVETFPKLSVQLIHLGIKFFLRAWRVLVLQSKNLFSDHFRVASLCRFSHKEVIIWSDNGITKLIEESAIVFSISFNIVCAALSTILAT